MEQYDIALIGGDARIAYMGPYLLEKGYRVIGYGISPVEDTYDLIPHAKSMEEAVEGVPIVIGGIPFLKEGKINATQSLPDLDAERLYRNKKSQILFGGMLPKAFVERCEEKDIQCMDFMEDEALTVFNAIATAEGAILEALTHQKTNIHGSDSLVLGYGRCGKVLADKLRGMGAKVTVCCRSEIQLANADASGMETLFIHDLEEKIHKFEYIYNTIPAVVLGKNLLKQMRSDVLVIDLASKPGGVDYAFAEELGIRAMLCPGLPGKYAPKISGKRLADFVIRNMNIRS